MLHRLLNAGPAQPAGSGHRGGQVLRLEALSDAVFGFAITLLVVSLEVPTSYRDLMDRMSGFLSFGICFALLIHFWFKHYTFFRRYGLQDVTTVVINGALLFVLLLYIYPLKYVFMLFIYAFLHIGPSSIHDAALPAGQARSVFAIFGLGFAVVHLLYGALYVHAFRMREHLKLTRIERFDTLEQVASCAAIAGVGLLSLILSQILPERLVGIAGWVYIATGLVAAAVGTIAGRQRKKIEQALAETQRAQN
jgi:uncharacterized membrane protein